jgi:hypothetical protein
LNEETIETGAASGRAVNADRPQTPFERARAELRQLGINLISEPGIYRFRYLNQGAAAPYLTEEADDLARAIEIGRALANHTPMERLAPLGPMGGGKSRRGAMIRHNRKIAAQRRKGKTVKGAHAAAKPAKSSRLYLKAIDQLADKVHCTDLDAIAGLASVQGIAVRFGKGTDEVARDINRLYFESYQPRKSRRLNLLDPWDEDDR